MSNSRPRSKPKQPEIHTIDSDGKSSEDLVAFQSLLIGIVTAVDTLCNPYEAFVTLPTYHTKPVVRGNIRLKLDRRDHLTSKNLSPDVLQHPYEAYS